MLISYILLFATQVANGQNPYNFIIGAEEFSTMDIYGINQSKDGVYWIVGNKGLHSYDGYVFTKYENPKQLSSSLFNLKQDYNGDIYCNNFNGQIFRIKNNKMELFHTVPDSLLSSYIGFDFLSDNTLVVYSKYCYKITNEDELKIQFKIAANARANLNVERDNQGYLLSHNRNDFLFKVSPNATDSFPIILPEKAFANPLQTVNYQDRDIFILTENGDVMKAELTDSAMHLRNKLINTSFSKKNLYTTANKLWLVDEVKGVSSYPIPLINEMNSTIADSAIFENFFISSVFEDQDQNILLGTFGSGIIIIPKTGIKQNIVPSLNITQLTLADSGNLYLGDENGHIYLYDYVADSIKLVYDRGVKKIDLLEYFPSDQRLFFMAEEFTQIDEPLDAVVTNSGAVKDVAQVEKNTYLLATNSGIIHIFKSKNRIGRRYLSEKRRAYSIAYNSTLGKIAYGSSSGLFILDKEGIQQSELTFKGKTIIAFDLIYSPVGLLISTKKYGLLKEGNNGLEAFINEKSGLLGNSINQFKIKGAKIYIASEKGFQIFDTKGKLLQTLSHSDGLTSTIIKDFEVSDNDLWLLHNFGLQRIPLVSLNQNRIALKIKEVLLFSNDSLISVANYSKLNYQQNRIRIKINAPSLSIQQDISYSFLLQGIDYQAIEKSYHDNTVEYNALPPGEYTFSANLNFKGKILDSEILNFTILKPFWLRWWFITLCVVILAAVIYLIFQNRLKALEKQAFYINEINSSKLTALQSQMNPHFIFNALNSIQDYIMRNERKVAGKYLGKFADLMRIYLNSSELKSITLKEEVNALQLYLELEKLRFGDSLVFNISVDDGLHEHNISFPSLLIQPYAENALKHGLFHKTGQKLLDISFRISDNNQFLECELLDNGIGRRRSGEINKMSNPNHVSFSTTAAKRRIDLINHNKTHHIFVLIEDLYNDNNVAKGTRVVLNIPIKNQ